MHRRSINKDYYGGALMVALGLGAAMESSHFHVGTLAHMGPGFFPAAVGGLLAVVGAMIAVGGSGRKNMSKADDPPAEWRGWFCILAGIAAFILLGYYTGLLPATFAIVFISALGDRQNSINAAAVLAFAMCAVAYVIFHWALQLQFPLLHWG